jgi:agmatine/peptidylarginine deiminase
VLGQARDGPLDAAQARLEPHGFRRILRADSVVPPHRIRSDISYPEIVMSLRLPAEWEPQSAVMLAWPHPASDWAAHYDAVEHTYVDIVAAVSAEESALVVCRDEGLRARALAQCERRRLPIERIRFAVVSYDDTWLRDTGPLCVLRGEKAELADFTFNAWGEKYPCENDDALSRRLHAQGCLGEAPLHSHRLVLEGGSVETDGRGTLLTTISALLAPTRNPGMTQADVERTLRETLGFDRILWLAHGHIEGDDTDGHIDTLARFCDAHSIAHSACIDREDIHWKPLQALAEELTALRTREGTPYRLIPLPLPRPIRDAAGRRLPANYANFLIINNAVLVPTYQDPADAVALERLAAVFPDRQVQGIDCRALVHQYGSLHCMTMQLPKALNP